MTRTVAAKALRSILAVALAAGIPLCTVAAPLVWGTGKWGEDTWGTASITTTPTPQTVTGTAVSTKGGQIPASTASFSTGLSKDGGKSYLTVVNFGDSVQIAGEIAPASTQWGLAADIFVVALAGKTYFMRNLNGAFVPWSGAVADLQPYRKNVTLSQSVKVDLYTGSLSVRGEIWLFLGYMTNDGVLQYTPTPLKITVF